MAVCRHCGAIIDDGLDICPDCGQSNTDVMDESYLDSLLSSLVASEPVERPEKKKAAEKKAEEEPLFEEPAFEEPVFDEPVFEEAAFEEPVWDEPVFEDISEVEDVSAFAEALDFEELPGNTPEPKAESLTEESEELANEEDFEDSYNLMDTDEDLELNAYNIFDEFSENDVDALIAKELAEEDTSSVDDFFMSMAEEDLEPVEEQSPEEDLFIGEDFFALTEDAIEDMPMQEEGETETGSSSAAELGLSEEDFAGLDDLFQGFSEDEIEEMTVGEELTDPDLEELLAAEIKEEAEGPKGKAKDERSIWQRLFGNVPIDPSKKKPEPTPEEIAAAKQKKEEAKKKSAEEKKLADAEKKEEAKKKKEEKARQAQLAKEEKQKKKMEAAKQVLEEMEDTRINRVGASIVFAFFGIIAVILIVGSNLFTYNISIKNAKKNFELALNNDVKYYTEAYNHIYGLEMRNIEDAELEDKILTVMFVNKELNSYNSYMGMKDYESALHSLIKGLYRYGVYMDHALEISIEEDMDFVRTQILRELEATFEVSEDESEILRNMLYESLHDDEKAIEYSREIYKIVKEAENLQ